MWFVWYGGQYCFEYFQTDIHRKNVSTHHDEPHVVEVDSNDDNPGWVEPYRLGRFILKMLNRHFKLKIKKSFYFYYNLVISQIGPVHLIAFQINCLITFRSMYLHTQGSKIVATRTTNVTTRVTAHERHVTASSSSVFVYHVTITTL